MAQMTGKVAFGRLRSEPLEYQGQIGQYSIKSRSEGDDIIQAHEAARPPEALENPIHQALECGRCITKAEGHNPELEQTGMCCKRRLDPGLLRQGHMPISTSQVQSRERLFTSQHIQGIINYR